MTIYLQSQFKKFLLGKKEGNHTDITLGSFLEYLIPRPLADCITCIQMGYYSEKMGQIRGQVINNRIRVHGEGKGAYSYRSRVPNVLCTSDEIFSFSSEVQFSYSSIMHVV